MLNLISIHPQLNEEYIILREHNILAALTLHSFTQFCAEKSNTCYHLEIFLQSYFITVCKITTVESLTFILVLLCCVIPNGHCSSEINFKSYICAEIVQISVVFYNLTG
jgi:hypothetical protein